MPEPLRFSALGEEEAKDLYGCTFDADADVSGSLSSWFDQPLKVDVGTGSIAQRRAGPCACLAPLQARMEVQRRFKGCDPKDCVRNAIGDALWCAGEEQRAVVVATRRAMHGQEDELAVAVGLSLEGAVLDRPEKMMDALVVATVQSRDQLDLALTRSESCFQSPLGALLLLFSAMLSRGLEGIRSDRDDASSPLITLPFGHASQEVVHLLICGKAVSNVFNGNVTFDGGTEEPEEGNVQETQALMLQGIPSRPDVGLLTILEHLRYCEVGSFLKRPKYPVWVVGSESHYTVMFSEDEKMQDMDEGEDLRGRAKELFELRDESGGGGFIVAELLPQLLEDIGIEISTESCQRLQTSGVVLWTELSDAMATADPRYAKEPAMAISFDLTHMNGILKKDASGTLSPRITHIKVAVPPSWEVCMDGEARAVALLDAPAKEGALVDCIRTKWPRAMCTWVGEDPSIV